MSESYATRPAPLDSAAVEERLKRLELAGKIRGKSGENLHFLVENLNGNDWKMVGTCWKMDGKMVETVDVSCKFMETCWKNLRFVLEKCWEHSDLSWNMMDMYGDFSWKTGSMGDCSWNIMVSCVEHDGHILFLCKTAEMVFEHIEYLT